MRTTGGKKLRSLVCFISILVAAASVSTKELTCGRTSPLTTNYIHGGKLAKIEQWPWQLHLKITGDDVDFFSDNDHANCGASVLDDQWIITAAHCFTDRKNPRIYLLNGFNYTRQENYRLIEYERILIHPRYQEYSGTHEFSTNDIALVKVSATNKFHKSIVRPCLPRQNSIIPPNSICYITGFGASSRNDNEQVKRIKSGKVAIKYNRVCVRSLSLSFYDSKTMICAGRARGVKANSCQGDSGGPLVCEGSFGDSKHEHWYLFGITSFGALDCSSYTSSVYTKVSTYVDWIEAQMKLYQ
jgi:secreted trypsin-like serine protease